MCMEIRSKVLPRSLTWTITLLETSSIPTVKLSRLDKMKSLSVSKPWAIKRDDCNRMNSIITNSCCKMMIAIKSERKAMVTILRARAIFLNLMMIQINKNGAAQRQFNSKRGCRTHVRVQAASSCTPIGIISPKVMSINWPCLTISVSCFHITQRTLRSSIIIQTSRRVAMIILLAWTWRNMSTRKMCSVVNLIAWTCLTVKESKKTNLIWICLFQIIIFP